MRYVKRKWLLPAGGMVLTVSVLILLLSWLSPHPLGSPPKGMRREQDPWNQHAVDTAVTLLRSGDLVFRTGADITSYMLMQMNRTHKTYSHCGIVMMEHGYPYVYHSIGGEDNPGATLRRDSAAHFFSPAGNERLGIARLDLSAPGIERLRSIVGRYYRQAIRFDLDFDLRTDDRMYCAEFAYKAIREAAGDSAYFSLSYLADRPYVGVDNLYDAKHAKIICDVRFK